MPRPGFRGRAAKGSVFPGAAIVSLPTLLRKMVEALLTSEPVCINVCNGAHEAEALAVLDGLPHERLTFHRIPTNEPWCRDHGPIFDAHTTGRGEGASINGLQRLGRKVSAVRIWTTLTPRASPGSSTEASFIGEQNGSGGRLDRCERRGPLLSPPKRACSIRTAIPAVARRRIEERLRDYLGVTDIFWLGDGIEGDDTDGHVDDLARFVSERTIVTVVEENRDDANYEPLQENLARLRAMTERKRPFEVDRPCRCPRNRSRRSAPARELREFLHRERMRPAADVQRSERRRCRIDAHENFPKRRIVSISAPN